MAMSIKFIATGGAQPVFSANPYADVHVLFDHPELTGAILSHCAAETPERDYILCAAETVCAIIRAARDRYSPVELLQENTLDGVIGRVMVWNVDSLFSRALQCLMVHAMDVLYECAYAAEHRMESPFNHLEEHIPIRLIRIAIEVGHAEIAERLRSYVQDLTESVDLLDRFLEVGGQWTRVSCEQFWDTLPEDDCEAALDRIPREMIFAVEKIVTVSQFLGLRGLQHRSEEYYRSYCAKIEQCYELTHVTCIDGFTKWYDGSYVLPRRYVWDL